MGDAGYVVAGYGVTVLALVGYLVSLRRRLRRASRTPALGRRAR